MFDVSKEDITEGSLSRALAVLAAPLVAQQVVVALGAVVDIFWLGRVNEAAVAAVGLVVPVYALISLPVMASYTGAQILTAQSVGADEHGRATRLPVHGAVLGAVLAFVLAALVTVVAPDIVGLLGADDDVFGYAVTYLSTYMFAYVPIAISDGLEGGFVGWGDSGTAFALNAVNIVVNAVLDPFLIFGWGPFPEWSVFGAAVASIVGVTVSAVLAVAVAASGRRQFAVSRSDLRVRSSLFREILAVGGPVGLQNAGRQAARLGMVAVISIAGSTAALAAYNVGAQLATIAFVPASGLANAATTVVGQNLGADRPDRARRATWLSVGVAVVALLGVGALQLAYPARIAETFAPALDGAGLRLTVEYLEILALGYWALGAIYTLESGFNGASRTSVSMYATLVQYWGIRLPIAAFGVFVFNYTVLAAFWAVTLSNVAAAVGLAVYFWHSTDDGMLRRAASTAAAD
ncbi:MATE family efflux transporter [Halobacterium litoreum]|uniref:Multidrug-efflux transporter n=1 Tax=Halobacterium litoreum TaxID=2039234 RepID=A0ABD5NFZ5_9EURY|nr:MATE family efflux transporter [Halobacterium litoreum]UHH13142.1 MATE family efflux transporter [Halobacterium litoreum]